ncbi:MULTISPECIES: FG-GAP-like repeat-containing protein [unclassified Streptomyces]|uniref:FG-GAP and VCBS repeat-containing protein n=1 Tax=unclassified Streptomyces TaxID=2593676 RepID=UPI001F0FEBA5|nr:MULTISPECIES: FG-GAP-like repeat-containing protein [unclassified Streptomyces]WSU03051.1 FG-GAP-like repeat-containing protein [Streptomyces sp. NBC_01124]
MIVRMDGSGDRVEASRRRLGRRSWVVGGGAVVVALAVAAGVVIADEEPARIAAPYRCGTGGAHAPAKAPQGAVDFDGDGRPDLALGSMGSVEGGAGGGSIEVAYGAGGGTGIGRCQYLTQDDAGIPGKNRDEAFFGTDVVARDFDGDGYTDLAASVFDWKPSVIIMWGSGDGLSRAARVPGTDVSHVAWDNDPILDEQLVAGDFDGDGHPDLVFGLGSDKGLLKGPFERDGTPAGTGRVPAPRRPAPDVGDANYGDLVAGDLDGDGIDDLVSFHAADPEPEAPWAELNRPVSYLRGGRGGFTQPEGIHLPDAGEGAIGDVDGDGIDDLVLSPRGGDASRSSVTVLYGAEDGPGRRRTTTVDRDTPGVPGAEPQDEDAVFTSLDTGDVNGDGYADVVAGSPRWDVYGEPGPEQVLFLAGGPDGLSGEGARLFDGDDLGAAPGGDADFGAAVGLTDLDGDGYADLVVTAPGSDTVDGVAYLLPGTANGPATRGVTRLSGDTFDDTEGLGLLMGGGEVVV